jgi:DNA phosphorothioation-dependent restriction protein DptH
MGSVPQGAHATFPDFNRVRDIVEQSNAEAYNRLSELFSLNVFRREFVGTSLAEMLATPTILDFSQIASDGIKNTLAELVVLSAHAYLNSLPHSGRLRTCIVVDEAHRILQADYVEKLALECRAYGVSLVLASQYPSHFPASVADCLATKIIHGNDRDRNRVKSIAGMLGLDGRDAEIADLGMFDAIFSNRHFRNVSIRTLSYPIRLVLEQLQQSGTLNRDQIAAIEGVDTDKLPVGNIIRHMQTLGVCEVVGDCIRYLGRPY